MKRPYRRVIGAVHGIAVFGQPFSNFAQRFCLLCGNGSVAFRADIDGEMPRRAADAYDTSHEMPRQLHAGLYVRVSCMIPPPDIVDGHGGLPGPLRSDHIAFS